MEYSGYKDTLRKKEIKDLLDFVLTECGDMMYQHSIIDNGPLSIIIQKGFSGEVSMERILYAFILLKEKFDITLKTLKIDADGTPIPPGYLEKMEGLLKYISDDDGDYDDLLPMMPDSVVSLILEPFGEEIKFIEQDQYEEVSNVLYKTSGFQLYDDSITTSKQHKGDFKVWLYTENNDRLDEWIVFPTWDCLTSNGNDLYFYDDNELNKFIRQYEKMLSPNRLNWLREKLKNCVNG